MFEGTGDLWTIEDGGVGETKIMGRNLMGSEF